MRFERGIDSVGAPATCPGCAASTYRSLSFARWFSPLCRREEVVVGRSVGRAIGLDVHRDFCEVAICEAGRGGSGGGGAAEPGGGGLVAAGPGGGGWGGVGGGGGARGGA